MTDRFRFKGLLHRGELRGIADIPTEREAVRRSRRRLLLLLLLFNAVLIAAVLLSFQQAELIEQEHVFLETREVYEVWYEQQIITTTTVLTEIIPYGSVP